MKNSVLVREKPGADRRAVLSPRKALCHEIIRILTQDKIPRSPKFQSQRLRLPALIRRLRKEKLHPLPHSRWTPGLARPLLVLMRPTRSSLPPDLHREESRHNPFHRFGWKNRLALHQSRPFQNRVRVPPRRNFAHCERFRLTPSDFSVIVVL